LYASPSIIRRTRFAGNVSHLGETEKAHKLLVTTWKIIDFDERIVVENIVGKLGGKVWNGFFWLRIEASGRFL
jgi:hypothetical protein